MESSDLRQLGTENMGRHNEGPLTRARGLDNMATKAH